MRRDRSIFAAGFLVSVGLHAVGLYVLSLSPSSMEIAPRTLRQVEPMTVLAVFEMTEPQPQRASPPPPPAQAASRPGLVEAPTAEPEEPPTATPQPAAPAATTALADPVRDSAAVQPRPEPAQPARRMARGMYEHEVARWVERQREYPLAARRRGWEGTAIVRVQLASDGSLIMAQLVRDTGHAALDRAALGMVQRAAPYPRVPVEVGESRVEVLVPIQFTLGS